VRRGQQEGQIIPFTAKAPGAFPEHDAPGPIAA
jgi:hypothetical protein